MPFDVSAAARLVRSRHADGFGFRRALLDLLFAAGCNVREQAVALEHGDAVVMRTQGPAAPVGDEPLWVIALDLDPPGGSSGGTWAPGMQGLGGPAVVIGWLAALHALLKAEGQRPWELVYVRGPALGTASFAAWLLESAPPGSRVVHLAPRSGEVAAVGEQTQACDLVRLDLIRPRNIWRFPACDHTAAVSVDAAPGQAVRQLRAWLQSNPAMAWTLHDLRLLPGARERLTGVVRTSQPLPPAPPNHEARPLPTDQRLLFPVNDALSALLQLGNLMPAPWHLALPAPLAAEGLPDGLRVYVLVPAGTACDDLPDRIGTLTLHWSDAALGRAPAVAEEGLALQADETRGILPASLDRTRQVWRFDGAVTDAELPGLQRAFSEAVRRATA
jgi:hypothetical protein